MKGGLSGDRPQHDPPILDVAKWGELYTVHTDRKAREIVRCPIATQAKRARAYVREKAARAARPLPLCSLCHLPLSRHYRPGVVHAECRRNEEGKQRAELRAEAEMTRQVYDEAAVFNGER